MSWHVPYGNDITDDMKLIQSGFASVGPCALALDELVHSLELDLCPFINSERSNHEYYIMPVDTEKHKLQSSDETRYAIYKRDLLCMHPLRMQDIMFGFYWNKIVLENCNFIFDRKYFIYSVKPFTLMHSFKQFSELSARTKEILSVSCDNEILISPGWHCGHTSIPANMTLWYRVNSGKRTLPAAADTQSFSYTDTLPIPALNQNLQEDSLPRIVNFEKK